MDACRAPYFSPRLVAAIGLSITVLARPHASDALSSPFALLHLRRYKPPSAGETLWYARSRDMDDIDEVQILDQDSGERVLIAGPLYRYCTVLYK
jgi:hypothetical protein